MAILKKKIDRLLDEGTASSVEKAKKLLTEEASNSNVEAQLLLFDFIVEYEPEQAAEAVKWLNESAKNGSGRAAYLLSDLYDGAVSYPVNVLQKVIAPSVEESDKWLQRSFELGYFEAQWLYVQTYFDENKYDEALSLIKILKKLKTSDHPDAPEAVQDIKQWAREMEEKIKELQKASRMLEQAERDPASPRPELLYNTALSIRYTDDQKAKQLLKLASDRGWVPASILLANLTRGEK